MMLRTPYMRSAIVALAAGLGLAGAAPAGAQTYTYQRTLGVAGVPGIDNGHLSGPIGGVVDTVNGHFFIADFGNNRVQVFDTSTLAVVATLGVSGVAGSDNAHFNEPAGVGFDAATGRIFVADGANQRVQIFDAKTFAYVATLGVTGVTGTDNAHFNLPSNVKVNSATHQLYVSEYGNDRVQIFDTGTLAYVASLGVAGVPGNDNAHFDQVNDAEINPLTNQIMVADGANGRIQLFDPITFAYVGTFGGHSSAPGSTTFFSLVYTATVDPTTNLLLIADGGIDDRVQVFDARTNNYVMTLGATGSAGASNSQFAGPNGIAVDPAHARLFIGDVQNDRVQVFTIAPSPLVASVLPGSRSVELGSSATVFATMINSGAAALEGCSIALPSTAPAGLTLNYQTTNAANALTGSANTPVTIAGNDGVQSFLISFQGTGAFSAPGMPLDFECDGAPPAAVITGVDTVDLTMSSTPIADIIALAATSTDNGIVELPEGGAGAFAVASTNLGLGAKITVSVDTGSATLPVTAALCQSNPSTGACLAAPTPTVSLDYAGGTTPTFSIFLQSMGAIPFDPANSRVFVRFKDTDEGVHGSTSVAVATP